ncbi:cytochrome P450 [Amycolatopsis lexingtonensis]|uniref:Cytochrome P450 n=1 Tax=Amycolatopsis lexingtonensis TaxID=218822 RepID=A0ABR9I0U4_9PSEU|nr:cytochrome P450 [Amycolatopsis lexingtonensis]MBE1496795.1 cytochrome P450 [Amycolatopsis lexingtonensis]
MTTPAEAPPAGLFTAGYYQDPYPTLDRLREHDPVHEFRFPVGDVRMWLVTRYDDVRALLADPRFSSEGGTWGNREFREAGLVSGAGSVLERAVTVVDPPAHTRLRRLAMSAFTTRRVERWRDALTGLVDRTLDRCAALGTFDVMDDFAGVVSSEMLGAILGLRIERHRDLVDALTQAFPSDPALMDQVPAGFARICEYAEELVAEKRRTPADDLTSALVEASEDGDRLDERELVAMVAAMIMAGSDTVRAFLGNAVLALLDHPDQRAALTAGADTTAAVEELLRYEGALTTALFRVTTEDVDFAGTRLPAGSPVIAGLLAANRDPARFPDPGRLDLARTGPRHVGFGHGLHNCLGAALARLEIGLSVTALFRRFPGLRLATGRADVRYIENWAMRRLTALPVDAAR